HVGGVRQGPPHEGQHRHPPPARAAARQRHQPDGAVPRAAAVAARVAGALLRRRDRDGRQHLARRPRRRPHADAVDQRPQRRLLARDTRPAAPAGHPGPGVRLPERQRRGADGEPVVAAALDAADDPHPQEPPRLRARHLHRPRRVQSLRAVLRARAAPRRRGRSPDGRRHPVRQQPLAVPAAGRARPAPVGGAGPRRARGRRAFSETLRAALPAHARLVRVLLVPSDHRPRGGTCMTTPGSTSPLPVDTLPAHLAAVRWFCGKGREFIVTGVPRLGEIPGGPPEPRVVVDLVEVRYDDGAEPAHELYQLPLALYEHPQDRLSHAFISWHDEGPGTDGTDGTEHWVHAYDAVHDREAMAVWLAAFAAAEPDDGDSAGEDRGGAAG